LTFQDVLICVLILLVGAAFCFVGYRFFRGLIAVWGFFAGFNLGAAGMTALFGQNFLGTTTGWILGLVVGLVFAVVASIVVAPDIAHITNDHSLHAPSTETKRGCRIDNRVYTRKNIGIVHLNTLVISVRGKTRVIWCSLRPRLVQICHPS